jgi:Holliday junction DNA helicase RuvA
MIRWLRGTVQAVAPTGIVLDIGGVGIGVQCTPAAALSVRPGEQVELLTSLVVREDGWTMFGFFEADERDVFDLVQTVSGIGPRIALALLASLTPDELRAAIASEDMAALTKVPGIGRKGAQRMVLELKDRLGLPSGSVETATWSTDGWQGSVRSALVSLGWQPSVAERAVDALEPPVGEPDVGALLKAALVSLDHR